MIKVNKQLKIFICFLLIFTMSFSLYQQQKASAGVVSTVAEMFNPEVAGALFVGELAVDGYQVVGPYIDDVHSYVKEKISSLTLDGIEKLLHVYNDSGGNKYVGLTDSGKDWMKSAESDYFKESYIPHSGDYLYPSDFVQAGINLHPFKTDVVGTEYANFQVSAGSQINFIMLHANFVYSGTTCFKITAGTTDLYCRVVQVGTGQCDFQTSRDALTWKTFSSSSSSNSYLDFGYKVINGSSGIVPNETVTKTTLTTVATNQTVSVPVTATTSTDGTTTTTYTVADGFATKTGATDYVREGLTDTTATNTGTITGDTTTDTSADTNTGIISTAVNGIKTFVGSLLDVVTQILDWLKGFVGNLINALKTLLKSIFDTLIDTVAKIWDWCGNLVDSILNGIKSIFQGLIDTVTAIYDWLSIDWAQVAEHINYIDIIKEHFKPFFDIVDLLTNIEVNPQSSDGKFYMSIPKEMGGDGQQQCVLDLTIGAVYIQTGRDIIKYGIWIGFLWFVIKTFSPKFNIN